MYITLKTAKKHLNIDEWFEEDDNYLISLIKASEDIVSKRINRPLEKCVKNDGELEDSVYHSILIVIGTLYNQRELVTPLNIKEVPFLDMLFDLNKKFVVG